MAKQKLTLGEFKAANPFCCFCGGTAATFDRDHVPPRIAFEGSIWPVGFEFPACERCNRSSKTVDQEFAMLCLFGGFGETVLPERLAHFRKVFTGIVNNNLPLAVGVKVSSNAKRRSMRERGERPEPGQTYSEQGMFMLPERAYLSTEILGFKLGCALHYNHFSKALPASAMVVSGLRTNAENMISGVPEVFLKHTILAPPPMRGKIDLSRQFHYRYAPPNDLGVGVFVCRFGDSFHLDIMTLENPALAGDRFAGVLPVGEYLNSIGPQINIPPPLSTHAMFGGPWP